MRSALASMLKRAARLRATSAQRGGRRLEGRVAGHCSQAITTRSAFVGRSRAAHLWATVRSANRRVCMVKIRPERNQAW